MYSKVEQEVCISITSFEPQFRPSTQSGTICCHPDRIWTSSVSTLYCIGHILISSRPHSISTKHSVGHVLLSSRYDLAQFSFNPTFHRAHFILIQTPFSFNQALSRACFVVIQIRSGPVQFRPYILSGTFYYHPNPIQFQPSTQSGPFRCHPDTIWPSSVSTIVSITTSDWHGADLISNLDIWRRAISF